MEFPIGIDRIAFAYLLAFVVYLYVRDSARRTAPNFLSFLETAMKGQP